VQQKEEDSKQIALPVGFVKFCNTRESSTDYWTTGYIFQEAESNGIPTEQDPGEIEGRRSTGNAGTNRTAWTWPTTMI
jgi:hypothetical protein